jgi:transcriptional regulator with PAS, ATPase and Fis domain
MDGAVVISQAAGYTPRRKSDRRSGLNDVVREVATDCLTHSAPSEIRSILTTKLRRLVHAKTMQFSELPGAPSIRVGQPVRTRDYIAFPVATADSSKRMVLEASFAPDSGIDDWTCQVLEAAASLATVVFELERLACLTDATVSRPVDGAAPLIGASLAMQVLRERIERVATTDFTVLIEGESERW